MPPLQPRELYLGFGKNFGYLVKSGGEGALLHCSKKPCHKRHSYVCVLLAIALEKTLRVMHAESLEEG